MNQSLTAYRGWNQNPRLQDVFIAARIQNEPAKKCACYPLPMTVLRQYDSWLNRYSIGNIDDWYLSKWHKDFKHGVWNSDPSKTHMKEFLSFLAASFFCRKQFSYKTLKENNFILQDQRTKFKKGQHEGSQSNSSLLAFTICTT